MIESLITPLACVAIGYVACLATILLVVATINAVRDIPTQ